MAPVMERMNDWFRLVSWGFIPWFFLEGFGLHGHLTWNLNAVLDTMLRSPPTIRHANHPAAVQPMLSKWNEAVGTVDPQLFLSPFASLEPDFPSFNSQRLDQQLALYADYLSRFGAPDVLIVGSSRSLQGIDPLVLQDALTARGYLGLKIYNFGINGATAQVVDLVLRRILTAEQLPRLIIWGDGSRALNSGRVDRTYNSIVASEGYKRLEAGVRPIRSNLRPEPAPAPDVLPQLLPELCMDWQAPTAAIAPTSTICSGLEQPRTIANGGIADESTARLSSDMPSSDMPSPESLPERSRPAQPTLVPDLTPNGFQPVLTRFNPAAYYRQFPRVSGRYDTNYVPFRLEGEQTAAAVAIASFVRSHRIPLVFVNLPLSGEYLDPVRDGYERRFRQHMQQLAAREGFLFRDWVSRWPAQYDYFADPSHLNHQGARAVAVQLVADPDIPWPLPRSISIGGGRRE